MITDEFPEWGNCSSQSPHSSSGHIHLFVADIDQLFARAFAAGAKPLVPVADQFYGDRSGRLADPFGHIWMIATHQEDVSPDEMQLEIDDAIADIVDVYTTHHLMPADPAGDALHLALASYHRCDFLLTWNCRHLANANKLAHIRRINGLLGLFVPALVTPLQLLGNEQDG